MPPLWSAVHSESQAGLNSTQTNPHEQGYHLPLILSFLETVVRRGKIIFFHFLDFHAAAFSPLFPTFSSNNITSSLIIYYEDSWYVILSYRKIYIVLISNNDI